MKKEQNEGTPEVEMSTTADEEAATDISPELAALLAEDTGLPWSKVGIVITVFLCILTLNIARGSEDGKFNPLSVDCGSHAYWYIKRLPRPIPPEEGYPLTSSHPTLYPF